MFICTSCKKISQDGKLEPSAPQKEIRENTFRNYVRGDTAHAERADWQPKVKHLDTGFREELLDLLEEFKDFSWMQGYLPPIKDLEYKIQYEGAPFREPTRL